MVGPTKLLGDLAEPGLDLHGGYLELPKGHGVGIELSEKLLRRYAAKANGARELAAA
ncbi:hypothetical protein D3C83_237760 [compost metagenome]